MVRKLLVFVILTVIVGASLSVSAFTGGTVNGFRFLSCDSVDINYDAYMFDRNNSGFGYEFFKVIVTDGDGTYLIDATNYGEVGSSQPARSGFTFSLHWAAGVADYNPIRVQLTSLEGNGFSQQYVWDFSGDCPGLATYVPPEGTSLPGPGARVPGHFKHRQIVCETPIFNLPGGQPVDDEMIHLNQTWFINPIPTEAPDGTSWTEIFVQGLQNPFIPTSCVNPDPLAVLPGNT